MNHRNIPTSQTYRSYIGTRYKTLNYISLFPSFIALTSIERLFHALVGKGFGSKPMSSE